MKVTTKQTLKYFWEKTKNYKGLVALTLFGVFLGVIFSEIVYGLIFKELFDTLLLGNSNQGAVSNAFALLFYFLGSMVIFNIGWRIAEFSLNYQLSSSMRDIENDAFVKLQDHSYAFFTNNFGGALVTKVKRLVSSYGVIMGELVFDLTPFLLKIIFIIGILFYFSKTLGLILLLWILIYSIIFAFLYKWKFKHDSVSAEADSLVTAQLSDSISNIINTKVFAKKIYEEERFYNVTFYRHLKRKFAWNFGSFIHFFQGVFVLVGEFALLYIAIKLWTQGNISTGTIVLLQVYVLSIMRTMWDLGRIMRNIFEAFADAEEMIEIIHQEPELKDNIYPHKCKIKEGEIDFDNVGFKYENKKIFCKLNLKISSKESVGLVGESGAGKSTITKILLRFADTTSGRILIDGQDIRNLTQDEVRENISYVPQDSILFHRTLAENIAYSNPEASKKEIIEAAKKANIHDFIESLPLKYKTLVGERGIKLSGGERQRVAIARALLKNAPIVILDEATSSLDSKSEQLIQHAIENLMKNKTTIIIAHRLSTIKKVDRIIVLEKGKIIEDGTHAKLIKDKGKYYELWKHQSSNI